MQRPDSKLLSARLRTVVDPREFGRFVVTGVVATAANLLAVWLARHVMAFQYALIIGVAAGASVSFPMSKRFAFRSAGWKQSHHELIRFALVYAIGVLVYWTVAMITGKLILPVFVGRPVAELMGAFVGAGTMTFTSYFGHRYYTYRHGRAAAAG